MVAEAQILPQEDFNNSLNDLIAILKTISEDNLLERTSESYVDIARLTGKIKNALNNAQENDLNISLAINMLLNDDFLNAYLKASYCFSKDSNLIIPFLMTLLLNDETSPLVLARLNNFMSFVKSNFVDFKNTVHNLIIRTTTSDSSGFNLFLSNGTYPINNHDNHFQILLYQLLDLKNQAITLGETQENIITQWQDHLIALIISELDKNLAPFFALYEDELLRKEFLLPAIQKTSAEKQKSLVARILKKINDIADPDYPTADKQRLLAPEKYISYATTLRNIINSSLENEENSTTGTSDILAQIFDALLSTPQEFEQNLAVINYFFKNHQLKKYIIAAINGLTSQRRRELNAHLYQIIQNSRLHKNEDSILLNGKKAHEELHEFHVYIKNQAQSELVEELPIFLNNLESNLDILAGLERRDANLSLLFRTFFSAPEIVLQQETKLKMEAAELKKKNTELKTKKKELAVEYSNLNAASIEQREKEINADETRLTKELNDFDPRYMQFDNYSYSSDKPRFNETKKITLLNDIYKIVANLSTDFALYPESFSKRLQIDALYQLVLLISKTAPENNSIQQEAQKLLNLFALLGNKFGEALTCPHPVLPSPLDENFFVNTELNNIKTRLGQGPTDNKIVTLLKTAADEINQISSTLSSEIKSLPTLNSLNAAIEKLEISIKEKINASKTNQEIKQQLENLTKIQQELAMLNQKLTTKQENLTTRYLTSLKELTDYHESFTILPSSHQQEYDSILNSLEDNYKGKNAALGEIIKDIQQLSENNTALLNQLQEMDNQWDDKKIKEKLLETAISRRNDFEKIINYISKQEKHVKSIASIYTIEIANESSKVEDYTIVIEDLLSYAELDKDSNIQNETLNVTKKFVTQNLDTLNEKRKSIEDLVTTLKKQPQQTKEAVAKLAEQAKESWVPDVENALAPLKNDTLNNEINLFDIDKNELDKCYNSIQNTYVGIAEAEKNAEETAKNYSVRSNPVAINSTDSHYVDLFNLRQERDSLQNTISQETDILIQEKERVIKKAYEKKQLWLEMIDSKIAELTQVMNNGPYPEKISTELSKAELLSKEIETKPTQITDKVTLIHKKIQATNLETWTHEEHQELENIEAQFKIQMLELSNELRKRLHAVHKEPYKLAIQELEDFKSKLNNALPEGTPSPTAPTICGFNHKLDEIDQKYKQINISIEKNLNVAKKIISDNISETTDKFTLKYQQTNQTVDTAQDAIVARSIQKEKNYNQKSKIARGGLILSNLGGIVLCTAIGFFVGGGPLGALAGFLISSGVVASASVVGGKYIRRKNKPAERKHELESDIPAARESSSIISESNMTQRSHSKNNDQDRGAVRQEKTATSTPIIVARKQPAIIYNPHKDPSFKGGKRSVPVNNNQSISSQGKFANTTMAAQANPSATGYDSNQMHHRYLAMRR